MLHGTDPCQGSFSLLQVPSSLPLPLSYQYFLVFKANFQISFHFKNVNIFSFV